MDLVDPAGLAQGRTFLMTSPNPVDHEAQQIFMGPAGAGVWSLISTQLQWPDSDLYLGVWATKAPTCKWDCEQVPDGMVGITDFLELLSQWFIIGGSCDFDGGGVGITDFLKLLANWGACP